MTQAENLKKKGLEALNEKIKTVETIEMTSADLSQMDKSYDDFRMGQYVFVDSPPHGMENEKFLVTKMTPRLSDPGQNKLTFGRVRSTFTQESNKNNRTVEELVNQVERAKQDISMVNKQKMYRLYLVSTGGNIFKNQEGSTTLQAIAYSWDKEITASLADSQFQWLRSSQDLEGDAAWNTAHADSGKQVEVTAGDVPQQATFICKLKEANAQAQITITMVQDGVSGIEIGGVNLQLGTQNWDDTAFYSESSKSQFEFAEDYMVLKVNTFPQLSFIPVEVGRTYTLSIYVKADSAISNVDFIVLGYFDSEQADNRVAYSYINKIIGTDWERISYTFTVPNNAAIKYLSVGPRNPTDPMIPIYFRRLKVENGNQTTAWCPAFEDIYAYIDKRLETTESKGGN